MKKVRLLGYALVLTVATACAPVHYDAAYYERYGPTGRISVDTSYHHTSWRSPAYGSIEVTLFADSTFVGLNFQPVHFVIHDGDYVKLPFRNKRGHLQNIYAHYHKGDLHFDLNRQCRNVSGSSRFKYDKRWDKGRSYDFISAGNDYDLRGYKLSVRKHTTKNHLDKNRSGRHDLKSKSYQSSHNSHRMQANKAVSMVKVRPQKTPNKVANKIQTKKNIVTKKQGHSYKYINKNIAPGRVPKNTRAVTVKNKIGRDSYKVGTVTNNNVSFKGSKEKQRAVGVVQRETVNKSRAPKVRIKEAAARPHAMKTAAGNVRERVYDGRAPKKTKKKTVHKTSSVEATKSMAAKVYTDGKRKKRGKSDR